MRAAIDVGIPRLVAVRGVRQQFVRTDPDVPFPPPVSLVVALLFRGPGVDLAFERGGSMLRLD
jgi:hypothetical protein